MQRTVWVFILLLFTSLSYGKAILVLTAAELENIVKSANFIPNDYQGEVISKTIDVEDMFDVERGMDSSGNIEILKNYIQQYDRDFLLDGVVLIGDFPLPTPHYNDEPPKSVIEETIELTSSFTCTPSRQSPLTQKRSVRDTEAVLAHYNRAEVAARSGQSTDDDLSSSITDDLAMAQAIRAQHPLFTHSMVNKEFWVSRLNAPDSQDKHYWHYTQDDPKVEKYRREFNREGLILWGMRFLHRQQISNYTPKFHPVGGPRFFSTSLKPEDTGGSISFDYSYGYSPSNYPLIAENTRMFNHPELLPKKGGAALSVYHTSDSDSLPEQLGPWLLLLPWYSEAGMTKSPEGRLKMVVEKWFTQSGTKSIIYSTSPMSYDFTGDVFRLLLENHYQYIGDFFLDLQKVVRRKSPGKGTNNLALFGNGMAHMPKLNLSTINKDALMAFYPDTFTNYESDQIIENPHDKDEERITESVNTPPKETSQQESATTYSQSMHTAVNIMIMAGYALLQRQLNPAEPRNRELGVIFKYW